MVCIVEYPSLQFTRGSSKHSISGERLHFEAHCSNLIIIPRRKTAFTPYSGYAQVNAILGTTGDPRGTNVGVLHTSGPHTNISAKHPALFIKKCKIKKIFFKFILDIFVSHSIMFQNGFISGLPYFCALVLSFPFSWIADKLITSNHLSVGWTKKLMQAIGQIIPAIGLIGLSYVGCDMLMATVWLCICVGANSAVYSGYQVRRCHQFSNSFIEVKSLHLQ